MKSIKTIRTFVLMASIATLAMSCNKEELPIGDTSNSERFTISVIDGGYAPNSTTEQGSRAVENGYTTTFTAGDKIGIYAVKADNTYTAENVCLTLTNEGGKLVWKAPDDKKLWFAGTGVNMRYFAYYPYADAPKGTLAPSKTSANEFFVDMVAKWTPDTNQSTHALYSANDLIIGAGTVGNKQSNGTYPLTLSMRHAMALVVIELPTTIYKFTNTAPAIPDYHIAPNDIKFYGFTPYHPSTGTYRYLVKPNQSGVAELYGSYTISSNPNEYAINTNGIASEKFLLYNVDPAKATTQNHNLQVGDFYMKDGSLLGKDETPNTEQKAACVGIVMKVGREVANTADWRDDCNYVLKSGADRPTIHAYVLALRDANDGRPSDWGPAIPIDHKDRDIAAQYGFSGFYGYRSTYALKEFAETTGRRFEDFYAAYIGSIGYEKTYPAPICSSGWFLPSGGQCKYLAPFMHTWIEPGGTPTSPSILLQSITKVLGSTKWQSGGYWSSSESWVHPSVPGNIGQYSPYVSTTGPSVQNAMRINYKTPSVYIRSILAF